MFYTRINKIKIFNNREGFLGLFNNAELQIYSLVTGRPPVGAGLAPAFAPDLSPQTEQTGQSQSGQPQGLPLQAPITIADLIDLTDEQRKERLLAAVLAETERFAQCYSLEINRVKDNQSLTFGDAGLVIYQSEAIPDELNLQLWVIESDCRDVCHQPRLCKDAGGGN
jgi:hypothetical protein